MNLNLTEAEIIEVINNRTYQINIRRMGESGDMMGYSSLLQNKIIKECDEKIRAIAKEYEKRGKERDKLLDGLRDCHRFIPETSNSAICLREKIYKLITECEEKK